ncbi:MAG: glycosyltransferase, partial [Pseudomonadota bacterium]|nr:glycosyltransferase [Pseudomonadota bacterium]
LMPLGYRLLSPWAAAVVAVSQGIADELTTGAGIARGDIHTIHNAAMVAGFAERAAEAVTHPWLEDRSAPVLVTAGRLVPQKDHATLLRALALRVQTAPARLLVLGTGPLRERLENLARELGIADAVAFLGFQENPLPYIRRADAFVLTSVSEGFGNVLVEAMGCGTPVISTDCRHGPAEILAHGRHGLLVPPENPSALAEALALVPTLRTRWPPEALKARAGDFADDVCAARYEALFRTIVARETGA